MIRGSAVETIVLERIATNIAEQQARERLEDFPV